MTGATTPIEPNASRLHTALMARDPAKTKGSHFRAMGRLTGSMAQGVAAMLLILSVAACDGPLWKREHSFRYRMIVEVETPAGLRVGSSVSEVTIVESPIWAIFSRASSTRFRGEAAAVDLPNGRTLFTLLDRPSDYAAWLPGLLFRDQLERADPIANPDREEDDLAKRVRFLNEHKPSAVVPEDLLPAMIYFTDVRDPTTVRIADPNGLGADFGVGVRLRRVTVEITDAPLSDSITARLPWFGSLGRATLVGQGNHPRPGGASASSIRRSSLRREF